MATRYLKASGYSPEQVDEIVITHMHVAAVQFPEPSVTMSFDSDPKMAAPAREKAYAAAAMDGYYVAVTHVSFPGIGKLRVDGKGYDGLPVNYSANR